MTTEKTGATDATSDGESSQGNEEEVQTTDEAIVSTAPTDGEPLATDATTDGEPSRGNEEEVATAPTRQTDATSGAESAPTPPTATDAPTLQTDEGGGREPLATDATGDGESVGALDSESTPNDALESGSLFPAFDESGSTPAREYFGDAALVELAGKVAGAYRKTFNLDLDKYEEARQDAALFLFGKARIDPSLGRERCVHWLRKRAFGELVREYQNANGLRRRKRKFPKRVELPNEIIEPGTNPSPAELRELDKLDNWRRAVKLALANLEVDEAAELEDIDQRIADAQKRVIAAEKRVETKKKLVCEIERGARPLRRVKKKKREKAVVFTIEKERELLAAQEAALASARKSLEKLVKSKPRLVDEATRRRRIVRSIIDSQTTTNGESVAGKERTLKQIAVDFGVSISCLQRYWAAFVEDCKNELQYSPLLRSKTPVLERNS